MILNSRALNVLGIRENEPDPFGGFYERVPGTNIVNGILQEYAAWRVFRCTKWHPRLLIPSSSVYLRLDSRCSPMFGKKLFTDCSRSNVQVRHDPDDRCTDWILAGQNFYGSQPVVRVWGVSLHGPRKSSPTPSRTTIRIETPQCYECRARLAQILDLFAEEV
jgi:hypothetical protein